VPPDLPRRARDSIRLRRCPRVRPHSSVGDVQTLLDESLGPVGEVFRAALERERLFRFARIRPSAEREKCLIGGCIPQELAENARSVQQSMVADRSRPVRDGLMLNHAEWRKCSYQRRLLSTRVPASAPGY